MSIIRDSIPFLSELHPNLCAASRCQWLLHCLLVTLSEPLQRDCAAARTEQISRRICMDGADFFGRGSSFGIWGNWSLFITNDGNQFNRLWRFWNQLQWVIFSSSTDSSMGALAYWLSYQSRQKLSIFQYWLLLRCLSWFTGAVIDNLKSSREFLFQAFYLVKFELFNSSGFRIATSLQLPDISFHLSSCCSEDQKCPGISIPIRKASEVDLEQMLMPPGVTTDTFYLLPAGSFLLDISLTGYKPAGRRFTVDHMDSNISLVLETAVANTCLSADCTMM